MSTMTNGKARRSDIAGSIRLHGLSTLSDNHYVLRKADFELRRGDGRWQRQSRESYDIGNGAAVLPIDRARSRVMLIRQFRWPAFENGYPDTLIEAIAGKLDGDSPERCAIKEAEEEAGVRITNLRCVFDCFMSPGAVKERLSLFVADYDSAAPRLKGGGDEEEGEDIATVELPFAEALAMIAQGEIIDAKTIMLLQWVALNPSR
ncbi:MAG TPA: NUDIX domain-containing protein [Rhizomicrobium sp.]|nr:NUDIX domain-containing protein [Rhizomicrobium sp.]